MTNLFKATNFTATKAKPLPVILLLDCSASMNIIVNPEDVVKTGKTGIVDGLEVEFVEGGTERITVLNESVKKMINKLETEENQNSTFLLSIIPFGGDRANDAIGPKSAADTNFVDLTAQGNTPLGSAIDKATQLIEDRVKTPGRAYRPVVVLVSDGVPTDSWESKLDTFISTGRTAKCDRMALGIGEETKTGEGREVLEKFIKGTGNEVFEASQSEEIFDFFNFVTMSVVQASVTGGVDTSSTPSSNSKSAGSSISSSQSTKATGAWSFDDEDSYW